MSILYQLFGKLLYFLYYLTQNYGIAIILFTIIVKTLLLPLNIKSTKSMRETQALQPALQHLQKKYKNSPDKLNKETAALYKIYGVNPMGGCLPLLLQLPIIYGLFGALRNPDVYVFPAGDAAAATNQAFLWIPNLANPDPYYILPILCVIFTFLTSKFNEVMNPTPDGAAQGTQKTMMYLMPLMIGFIAMGFPAGIALYWVVQNVFTFLQQFIMLRKKVPQVPVEEAMKKLDTYEKEQKAEIRVKRKQESQRRQELYGNTDNNNTRKEKKTSVKMTPASKKKVNRKTITKIPQREED